MTDAKFVSVGYLAKGEAKGGGKHSHPIVYQSVVIYVVKCLPPHKYPTGLFSLSHMGESKAEYRLANKKAVSGVIY